MTTKDFYLLIRYYEADVGEGFFDQNENFIMPSTVAIWLEANHHISTKDANIIIEKYCNNNDCVSVDEILYENEFSIFKSNEYKGYLHGLSIICRLFSKYEVFERKIEGAYKQYHKDLTCGANESKLNFVLNEIDKYGVTFDE